MGVPNQRLILTNLAAALANITVANGYHHTVATVALTAQDWATAQQSGLLPWLGIMPQRRRNSYNYFDNMKCVMPVAIVGHVAASTDVLAYDYAADLLDDIIAAVHVDSTRGGYAIDTKVTEDDDDAGDPDRFSGNGPVTVIAQLEISFIRGLSGS